MIEQADILKRELEVLDCFGGGIQELDPVRTSNHFDRVGRAFFQPVDDAKVQKVGLGIDHQVPVLQKMVGPQVYPVIPVADITAQRNIDIDPKLGHCCLECVHYIRAWVYT